MYESTVLANLKNFPKPPCTHFPQGLGLCRNPGGMYLIWKAIEYFQPKSILEIGFFAGQTLGLIYEAADKTAEITTVDIDYSNLPFFNKLFPNNNIKFIEGDSKYLNLPSDKKLDFVLIDGTHTFEYAENDLLKCLPLLHNNSIICMDEYKLIPEVWQVIEKHLLGQYDFVPFLCGVQEMFFHHVSHDASYFLDNFIVQGAENFIDFNNDMDYHGFNVLTSKCPYVFHENNQIFLDTLKFYNL